MFHFYILHEGQQPHATRLSWNGFQIKQQTIPIVEVNIKPARYTTHLSLDLGELGGIFKHTIGLP